MLKCLLWLFLFCNLLHALIGADCEIIMTLDRDYYNPFATSIKYDLKFNGIDKESVWNITYTIVDNRTGKITASDTFCGKTLNWSGVFYCFRRYPTDRYEYFINLNTARENFQSSSTVMNRQLKGHLLQSPLEVVLEPGKKQLLFTIRPCQREWMAAGKAGFENLFFGLYSGTSEIDYSFFITFRVEVKKNGRNGKNLQMKQTEKKVPVTQTQEELEKDVKDAEEKYRLGKISIDELNQVQNKLNQFFKQNRQHGGM